MPSPSIDATNGAFRNLVAWVENGGGHVHPSLELRGHDSSSRGIYATRTIVKGDLILRLPAQLVLSGEGMPEAYSENRKASTWLRCLASLYKAKKDSDSSNQNDNSQNKDPVDFTSYLISLPSHYDTLLTWTDDEIDQFLAGTTLCQTVQSDRSEKTMQMRYKIAVQPYLSEHDLLSNDMNSDEDQFQIFQRACMCLSTRGFHTEQYNTLQSSSPGTGTGTSTQNARVNLYGGPFLLPVVDLLNHNHERKCTTLQRNPKDNSFYMVAERDIECNEEIYHSYGSNLTSAQLLQTFGFVPECITILANHNVKADASDASITKVTPATFSRAEITNACQSVAINYGAELRLYMESKEMPDETWDVPRDTEHRNLSNLIPSGLLVPISDPLTDELITLCSLLLMPTDVFDDFMSSEPALFDKTVLEDYFLGKLVCKSLLVATGKKLGKYNITEQGKPTCTAPTPLDNRKSNGPEMANRALYGMIIRLEETKCLKMLRGEALNIMDSLDDDEHQNGNESNQQRVDNTDCLRASDDAQDSKRLRFE